MTGRRLSEPSFAFLLNAPALLAIILLVGYPIVYSAWLSLHRYNLKRPALFRFIGVENYLAIRRAEEFWAVRADGRRTGHRDDHAGLADVSHDLRQP